MDCMVGLPPSIEPDGFGNIVDKMKYVDDPAANRVNCIIAQANARPFAMLLRVYSSYKTYCCLSIPVCIYHH
jgi:hypothetical protein